METEKEVNAAAKCVVFIAELIRELGEIPSGHLYAQLIGRVTLDQYNSLISIVKKTFPVKEVNHNLIWTV